MCVGARHDDIMSPAHYREFAKLVGIELKTSMNEEGVAKAESEILNEINLARIRDTDLRDHYNKSNLSLEWHHLEYVERSYRKFKEAHELMDFTDLLIKVVMNPSLLPNLDTVIIDEAQDLSRLQWEIVEHLAKKCKHVYLAGDDDQAIFRWAGSDVESFLNFEGTVQVLQQSYRVPQRVHDMANEVITRLKHRQEKVWKAREFEGEIFHYHSFEYAPVQDGQWLIMAATNYMLEPIQEWLRDLGMLFEVRGSLSISRTILTAVYAWERLRAGKSIIGEQVAMIYQYMGPDGVAKGHKKFKHGDPNGMYDMATLKEQFGLQVDGPWMDALEKIGLERSVYLSAMLRRGVRFNDEPRIKLSTIHGAKGGEADNVLLLTDLSPKFIEECAKDDSDMLRLLYVGLTRTRKTLHIVLPKNRERSFPV